MGLRSGLGAHGVAGSLVTGSQAPWSAQNTIMAMKVDAETKSVARAPRLQPLDCKRFASAKQINVNSAQRAPAKENQLRKVGIHVRQPELVFVYVLSHHCFCLFSHKAKGTFGKQAACNCSCLCGHTSDPSNYAAIVNHAPPALHRGCPEDLHAPNGPAPAPLWSVKLRATHLLKHESDTMGPGSLS